MGSVNNAASVIDITLVEEESNINNDINKINSHLLSTQSDIQIKQNEIQKKANIISEKQKQVYGQTQEIDDKMQLFETRNKMLQLSIDRNIYKKKIIYSLLAVIIALIIGMLFFYSYFSKLAKI